MKVAVRREEILKLIETVPDEKLHELEKMIKILTMPEEEATEDEIKAIEAARKEYENGETYSFTIDQLRKKFLENE